MGPGPANADPRVLAAQSLPLLGHMHPPFLKASPPPPLPSRRPPAFRRLPLFALSANLSHTLSLPACLPACLAMQIMDEVQQGLRYLFQTDSKYTLCASGTGHSGMEMAIANLVERGETVVVGNNGIWVRARPGWLGSA
jgi:alanine-glyoxylate transaminase/serine-glyoxylate transaminase/serine-pyruvate transaminase